MGTAALLLGVLWVAVPACRVEEEPGGEAAPGAASREDGEMELTSSAFEHGGPIPRHHTCDGADLSPPLSWSGVPDGTRSLALIADDPDAPVGTWVHWVIYRISPDREGLPEGVPREREVLEGTRQGRNDFRRIGYGGPCPPRDGAHRYFFKLYALDAEPALGPGATKAELLAAMEGHVLAEARLMGTYRRG